MTTKEINLLEYQTPCDVGCHVLCASTDCPCDCPDHTEEAAQ